MRGLISAIRTLTIVPVPGKDADRLASALPWFPFVGLSLGALLYGVFRLASFAAGASWPEGIAAVVLALGTLFTGSLHLDGLADCADAFFSMSDKAKRLQIMKDPHVGAFGVIAIVIILLAKWVALTRLASSGTFQWIIAAYVVSRAAMVDIAVRLPYARSEAGTGSPFIEGARSWHLCVSMLAGAAFLVALFGPIGVAAIVFGWSISFVFGIWCRAKVGGVTGDLLGANSEIVETTLLWLGAAFAQRLVEIRGWEMIVG